MRKLGLLVLLLFSSCRLVAADSPASFVLMPSGWYGYHWEQTPDGLAKASRKQVAFTAAYRLPWGLALGVTGIENTDYAGDARVRLTGKGPSIGYVGLEYISAFYTFLYSPVLSYDYPSLDARTRYFGGTGSILDLGLHFGTSWVRLGPRVMLTQVSYKKSEVASGSESETAALQGSPWQDHWLEPYVGLWFFF